MKKQYIYFGLIGIAAVFVLWYISQENAAAVAAANSGTDPNLQPPDSSDLASYPNTTPLTTATQTVSGSGSPETTSNVSSNGYTAPTVNTNEPNHENWGCSGTDCEAAGLPVTVQQVPASVVTKGWSDIQSYQQKELTGVGAARSTPKVPPTPHNNLAFGAGVNL
jgi:hypothetical protein